MIGRLELERLTFFSKRGYRNGTSHGGEALPTVKRKRVDVDAVWVHVLCITVHTIRSFRFNGETMREQERKSNGVGKGRTIGVYTFSSRTIMAVPNPELASYWFMLAISHAFSWFATRRLAHQI